jgi:hypothetical protein
MAGATISPSQKFPESTSVAVYPIAAKMPGRAPAGSSITSASVTAGLLTFTGLVLNTKYTAYALVSGEHRYVDFAVAQSDVAAKRAQGEVGIRLVEVTVDLPSIGANAVADVNVPVPAGTCKPGDLIVGGFLPALNAGLHIQGVGCVTADSLRIRAQNTTAGALDAAAVSVTFAIIKV